MAVSTRLERGVCLALCAAQVIRAQPFGHPDQGKIYPPRPGFSLWLVEEFNTALDLDHDPIWTWSDGGLGEGQVRFVKEAIKFENGKMIIEANRKPEGRDMLGCSKAEVGEVTPKPLTSGEIRTRYNMFRYGYYEVHMKAPSVQYGNAIINGNYISTMFTYRDAKFRHWREIDVEVTGDSVESITMNVLYAENTTYWAPHMQATQQYLARGTNVRSRFHTYAFEWLPTGIKWFFDGRLMGTHGPHDKLPVPELSTKIMMNLWIFSALYDFGGREGWNNWYPMHSEYEWFRFYKWDGDREYPCHDPAPSCLKDDDHYLSANNPCDGIPQIGGEACDVPCYSLLRASSAGNATAAHQTGFI